MLGVAREMSDSAAFAQRTHDGPYEQSTALCEARAWLIACDQIETQGLVGTLTAAELARCARLRRVADRTSFTVTRAVLRRILARELDVEPAAVRIVEPAPGKPRLCASHDKANIDFSVSHTDGMSVVALARRGIVGVDIERSRAVPEKLKIAAEMFGDDAARAISALPQPAGDAAFMRLWAAGEAYVKAIGTGLAMRRERIPLRVGPDHAQITWSADFAEPDLWRLDFIAAPAGYVCCLVTAARGAAPSMAG